MRFICILGERLLRYRPTRTGRIVVTCVVLHNYLILNNFNIMFGIDENEVNDVIVNERNFHRNNTNNIKRGNDRRNELVQFFNQNI